MQFAIHSDNLERLHKKMDRIRTKCEKYGCDFVYDELGEEFRKVKDESGNISTQRFIIVECEGTAKVNGWKFVATIDHTEKGNVIRKISDEVEIPDKYRTAEPVCEHCNSKRHRKDTYIVYNEDTGEFKQVGSTCLCEFTGGFSAEVAASYISLFNSLIELESPYSGSSVTQYFKVRDILKYAVDYVDNLGYASTTFADGDYNPDSTKSKVIDAICYDRGRADRYQKESVESYREKFGYNFDSINVSSRVDTILDYFKKADEDSDYMNNLKVIANLEYVEERNIGYTVSMVISYNKHLEYIQRKADRERQLEAEATTSVHLGSEKDRITVYVKKVSTVTFWENQYGITIRYKIEDENGNILMWDSSTGIDSEKEVEKITGTIKKLDEFRGVKQTWITRCKVAYK